MQSNLEWLKSHEKPFPFDDTIKPFQGGVLNKQAIKLPKPVYSSWAKAVRAEGEVKVKIFVNEMGNVISVEIISGHPFLRNSALQAAREAEFSPLKAVLVSGVLIFNFIYEESGFSYKNNSDI